MMKCENCGTDIDEDSIYCQECGKSIAATKNELIFKYCHSCGTKNERDSFYCSNCGKAQILDQKTPAYQPIWSDSAGPPASQPVIYYPPVSTIKSNRKPIMIVGIALFLVMLLVAGLFGGFLLSLNDNPVDENPINKNFSAGSGNWIMSWEFDGDNYTIKFDLPNSDYQYYSNYQIVREIRYSTDYMHGLDFITVDCSVIIDIAGSINSLKVQAGLNYVQTANLALKFTQTCFPYAYDNVIYGTEEYWAFPLETIYNGHGDCEDKSLLFATLMEAIGYNTALLFFDGHVAVGVGFDSLPGGTYYTVNGQNYYYCETTGQGWVIGEIPEDFGDSHIVVVS